MARKEDARFTRGVRPLRHDVQLPAAARRDPAQPVRAARSCPSTPRRPRRTQGQSGPSKPAPFWDACWFLFWAWPGCRRCRMTPAVLATDKVRFQGQGRVRRPPRTATPLANALELIDANTTFAGLSTRGRWQRRPPCPRRQVSKTDNHIFDLGIRARPRPIEVFANAESSWSQDNPLPARAPASAGPADRSADM